MIERKRQKGKRSQREAEKRDTPIEKSASVMNNDKIRFQSTVNKKAAMQPNLTIK